LWVFVGATTVLYLIGRRTRALLRSVLDETFAHWVMSDGYSVYRIYNEHGKSGGLGDFCQNIYRPACLFARLLRCAIRYIACDAPDGTP